MKTLEWDDPIVLPETDFRPCLSKAQDKQWLARFPFKGQGLRTKKSHFQQLFLWKSASSPRG